MRLIQWAAVMVVFLAAAAPKASAQVVVNEILVKRSGISPHADQVIEIKNTGASSVSLQGWFYCHQFMYTAIPSGVSVPAGGFLLLHFNQSGTNTATDLYFAGDQLSESSDFALYDSSNFGSSSSIKAFVQFGAVVAGRQDVAQAAGLWTSGTFIASVPADHSIELCAAQTNTPTSYVDQGTPTLGQANGCGVAAEDVSWGRVKALFH